MVPIVEPEVLMDGSHSLEKCFDITLQTLQAVFDALQKKQVSLDAMLLKPNMIVSGKDSKEQGTIMEVAKKTIECLRKSVPKEVPEVVFLSGGQSEILATEHLNEMNKMDGVPWQLSFSYGRALQQSALQTWGGKAENSSAAQKALYHRAMMNSLARFGKYSKDSEK
jgi:fructose-bisphosphate aldolase class I